MLQHDDSRRDSRQQTASTATMEGALQLVMAHLYGNRANSLQPNVTQLLISRLPADSNESKIHHSEDERVLLASNRFHVLNKKLQNRGDIDLENRQSYRIQMVAVKSLICENQQWAEKVSIQRNTQAS